jgi:hypothetical protein
MCAWHATLTPHYWYHAGRNLDALLPLLKAAITCAVYKNVETFKDLHWLRFLDSFDGLAAVLEACETDFYEATEELNLTETQEQQMLALRGLLGRNVLEHCLAKRYGVDYGTAERYD